MNDGKSALDGMFSKEEMTWKRTIQFVEEGYNVVQLEGAE